MPMTESEPKLAAAFGDEAGYYKRGAVFGVILSSTFEDDNTTEEPPIVLAFEKPFMEVYLSRWQTKALISRLQTRLQQVGDGE